MLHGETGRSRVRVVKCMLKEAKGKARDSDKGEKGVRWTYQKSTRGQSDNGGGGIVGYVICVACQLGRFRLGGKPYKIMHMG